MLNDSQIIVDEQISSPSMPERTPENIQNDCDESERCRGDSQTTLAGSETLPQNIQNSSDVGEPSSIFSEIFGGSPNGFFGLTPSKSLPENIQTNQSSEKVFYFYKYLINL